MKLNDIIKYQVCTTNRTQQQKLMYKDFMDEREC